jgi:hypothetical protein
MRHPTKEEEWKKVADEFLEKWNMPHVIGAIDGKHIRMQAPNSSGSKDYNYKGYFSMNLFAICDANYNFLMYDVGGDGSTSDSAILNGCTLGDMVQDTTINYFSIPEPDELKGYNYGELPYYLVGDEIFPLRTWLMRPYSGKELPDEEKSVFNYRLSRARRVIENCFGILTTRWRIFHKMIIGKRENVQRYVLATMALHNYLNQTDNAKYCPYGFVDCTSADGSIKEGSWRREGDQDVKSMTDIPQKHGGGGRNFTAGTEAMQNALKDYVNGPGAVDWQLAHV